MEGERVMDKYNHWFARFMKRMNKVPESYSFGITICQTTYYSCGIESVSERLRKHEQCHKDQWKEQGFVKFLVTYLWYQVKVGYINNPYEQEARKKAEGV
jgi:hypothetical protein